MDAKYDLEQDILRIRWSEEPIEESDEEQPGVILDYDQEGNVVGVEILNASRKISQWQQLSSLIQPSSQC
jgi:uncharacterized protein YuzE